MDSTVMGFYGRRGAGKTLSQTAFAYSFLHSPLCVKCKHLFRTFTTPDDPRRKLTPGLPCPNLDKNGEVCGTTLVNNRMIGWKCFSNYNVSFASAYHENMAEYISQFPDELYQSVLLVDETPAVANSRRTMSSLNLMFSLFIEQLRKRRVHLFYTAQNPMRMDKTIYWQTDVAFNCKSSPGGRSVKLEAYDQWGGWLDNDGDGPGFWPPERPPDRTMYLTRADRFWQFYDTEEIVMPTEYYKRQRDIAKQNGLIAEETYVDPESPEGIAAGNEMNMIFDEITTSGVDYDVLVRRFQRRKLPVSRLEKELRTRGFRLEAISKRKQKVTPPARND